VVHQTEREYPQKEKKLRQHLYQHA
jgi:hypothetical protein